MNDTRILLAVSTSRYSRHLVDLAMREAQRLSAGDVGIDVLYILEQEDLEHIHAQLVIAVGERVVANDERHTTVQL